MIPKEKDLGVNSLELGLTNFNRKMFNFLVKTSEECEEFMSCFWRGSDKQFFAIAELREKRMKENNVEMEEFLNTYNNGDIFDKIIILEKMFQHPVTRLELELLEKKLRKNKITLKELHQGSQNPGRVLLKYLL